MHINSKFELNFVHIAVLAICPLLMTVVNFSAGIAVLFLSVISFVISLLICMVLAKRSSKNIRIFISALVSALVVVVFELMVKNKIVDSIGTASYYSILSTIILCIDAFYIDTKATSKNYLIKVLRLITVYSIILIIYIVIKELLSFGTIGGIKLFNFDGYAFFKTITFDFLLLGLLCALASRFANFLIEISNEKKMVYNKYKAKVRNEKTFIYEYYRRNKLLTSEVIINKMGKDSKEDDERVDGDDDESEKTKEKPTQKQKSVIKHKPRRKLKLRVSKEAKVEKLFDRKGLKGDNNNA